MQLLKSQSPSAVTPYFNSRLGGSNRSTCAKEPALDNPRKCDGGADPYWCADYVREYVAWKKNYDNLHLEVGGVGDETWNDKNAAVFQGVCLTLRESLARSDHGCCNAVRGAGC